MGRVWDKMSGVLLAILHGILKVILKGLNIVCVGNKKLMNISEQKSGLIVYPYLLNRLRQEEDKSKDPLCNTGKLNTNLSQNRKQTKSSMA